MTGKQTLIAILGVAAMLGGVWSWGMWLRARTRIKQLDLAARVRNHETARLRVVSNIAKCRNAADWEGA